MSAFRRFKQVDVFTGRPYLGNPVAVVLDGTRLSTEEMQRFTDWTHLSEAPTLSRNAGPAWFVQRSGPLDEAELALIARGLRIARIDIRHHAWCDNGPGGRAVVLGSAEQVLALEPDPAVLPGLFVGVAAPRASGDECAYEVRAFFPGQAGLTEDPVTGSLNAALAQWLVAEGLAPERYVASQGTALGRAGRVHIARDLQEPATLWVGGDCLTCIEGSVRV